MDIHVANEREYVELRELWCQTFGDEPEFVDRLYDLLNAIGYVVVDDDHVRSCLTLFEAGTHDGKPVWVSYAICTEERYQGNGFASNLIEYVRNTVINRGGLSLICPAELSLVSFYEKNKYNAYYYVRRCSVRKFDDVSVETSPLSMAEYNAWREEFLEDVPHVTIKESLLQFVKWDSSVLQSLLLINNGDAICTIESIDDNTISIGEIIVNPKLLAYSKEISFQIAQGLAKHFEVDNVKFQTLSNASYVENIQGMVFGDVDEFNQNLTMPYFGFPLQ